jgi:hypothetical protein
MTCSGTRNQFPGPDGAPEAVGDLDVETHIREEAMQQILELAPIDVEQLIGALPARNPKNLTELRLACLPNSIFGRTLCR